jgi:hypothetical protein
MDWITYSFAGPIGAKAPIHWRTVRGAAVTHRSTLVLLKTLVLLERFRTADDFDNLRGDSGLANAVERQS